MAYNTKQKIYESNKAYRQTTRGRAIVIWESLKRRCENRGGGHPCYSDVQLKIERSEFMDWIIPLLDKWDFSIKPSIDRINEKGHYELGNIQIIPLSDNIRRQGRFKNIHAPEGLAWCGKCQEYKDKSEFHKDKSNANGLDNNCKKCVLLNYHSKKLVTVWWSARIRTQAQRCPLSQPSRTSANWSNSKLFGKCEVNA